MKTSFAKKNQLLKLLEKGEHYHLSAKITSYKGIILDKEYALAMNLNIALSEFKEEFQANQLEQNAEQYIRLLNKDIKKIIQDLNIYYDDHIHYLISPNQDQFNDKQMQIIKESYDELDVLFWTVHAQKDTAEQAFEYINNDLNSEKLTKELDRIKSVDLIKVNFNGKQIDLVLLFWCLQNAGLVSFKSRKEISDFLENHFYFKITDTHKSIKSTDIEILLSKIMKMTPPRPSDPFFYDVSKDELFSLIDKSVDQLKEKITFIKNELNMPPTSVQDKLPKKR